MVKRIFLLIGIIVCASISSADDCIEVDSPDIVTTAPVSSLGIWVNPTDNTMENGLSVLAQHWPNYEGSLITYVDLFDPAYGLDSTKTYRILNIEYCIKHKDDNYYDVDESRIIIQEWGGSAPTETNLYEQLFDTDGWGFPADYAWTEPIPITDSTFILPDEFAFGWHIYWPTGGAFANWWLGLDTDAPTGNWYYYQGHWIPMTPYNGAFGVRIEVEEVGGSSIEVLTFGGIKALFR